MRLWSALAFIALFVPPLFAHQFSLQAIDDTVREMAIYQVSAREDIALFNDKLNHTIARMQSRTDQAAEVAHARELLKESTVLFQILQDSYTKETTLFSYYLESLFQGYSTILRGALKDPQLAPLVPLLHEIVDQLQTMVKLEEKITALINN
ncbi:hypothetical protein [Helicobacter ailurogastricus]|uniref:hypothetical protein n=1 Tax=Helicobacter ailurogastricus TaxID=1578720 RepID=UPI000CF09FB0|nr:hypothetical protein [Helicobacter ailurogastricus]